MAGGTTQRASQDPDRRLLGGRYRLQEVLGRGGMGTVWSGRDELLGRDVAVKEVLPPAHLSGAELHELRARILQEARAAARIGSAAAVTVYDVVEDGDHPWIVMERLAPRTLDDVLRERTLRPEEAAALGLTVLAALRAADAAGVLHRDVKPGNVMFRGAGDEVSQAVLTDFGIARFVGDPSATATGTVLGSPAYVAPERATGAPATLTSDLWSLGVTLWTAVEGVSPFQRDGALPTLTAIVTEEVPPAPHAGALQPVLDGLLRKDPADRLGPPELERALRAVADGTPVPAGPAAGRTAVLGTVPADAVPADAAARQPGARAAPAPAPRRPRRVGLLLLTLVASVALGLIAVGLLDAVRDGRAADDPATVAEEPDAGAGPEPSPSEPASEQEPSAPSDPEPSTETTTEQAAEPGAPDGFRLHRDDSGFVVAVPQDWEQSAADAGVRFRDPATGASLLVAQTDQPKDDPVADWEDQERSVSQRLSDYERVGEIEGATLREWQTADWEFTYTSDGTALHALNRNLITTPGGQAYALLWTVPEDGWQDRRDDFDVVFDSFEPR